MKWLLIPTLLLTALCLGENEPLSPAQRKALEAQLGKTVKNVKGVKLQIDRLQKLLDSLVQNQSNFAGYGVPAHGMEDIRRIRAQLYKKRTLYGELVARKLFLQNSLSSNHTGDPKTHSLEGEQIDPTPTKDPKNCEKGAVHVENDWYCISESKKKTEKQLVKKRRFPQSTIPPTETTPEKKCDLGTIEVQGNVYCLGHEPEGVMSALNTQEFLSGVYDTDAPETADSAAPRTKPSDDFYNQIRWE